MNDTRFVDATGLNPGNVSTAADLAKLRRLIDEAETKLDDMDAFTRSSLEFHLAVAHASHNRVLLFQLISLQHVSWPARNKTLTRAVAKHIVAVHRDLADLIEARDPKFSPNQTRELLASIGGENIELVEEEDA